MRRLASPALALLLASCAEIGLEPAGAPPPPPPRPSLRAARAVPATFNMAQVAHRKVDGLKLEIYNVGEGQARGNLLSELKSPESRLRPPILVCVIRHPKEGPVLFGAGFPEDLGGLGAKKIKGSALSPFKAPPGRDIVSQLERRGIKAGDVKWVILPDLAPEWAGRAGAFPNATAVLSVGAWTNPKRKDLETDLPDMRAFVPEERLKLIELSESPAFGPFEHGKDLFGDGTAILVDLDGGAAGGMGLWLNLDSGPVLLTGPAAFVYDNIYDQALPDRRFVVDLSSFAWNARAMREAAEAVPRLVILPAHDLSPLKLSPRPDVTIVP